MGAKGFYTAQEGHVVNVLAPVDITGGVASQAVNMADYAHATFIVQIGVSAAAFTKIFVEQCTDGSGSNNVAIAFDIFKQETAGASHDVLGARTAVAATGYTPSANDGIFYVIEVDAAQLLAGTGSYLRLNLTNGTNSVIASAVAILSGSRYGNDQSATVTA